MLYSIFWVRLAKKHFCEACMDSAQNFQQRTSQRTSPDWQSVTKADPASAARG
jgi:hypothetical protein